MSLVYQQVQLQFSIGSAFVSCRRRLLLGASTRFRVMLASYLGLGKMSGLVTDHIQGRHPTGFC